MFNELIYLIESSHVSDADDIDTIHEHYTVSQKN